MRNVGGMSPSTTELIAAISPKIGALGATYYFIPETLAKGKELGLDGFRFYILGRGGVLGNTNFETVHSAFGYFHLDLIERLWNSGAEKVEPVVAARAYHEAAAELGRSKLAGLDLGPFCSAAERVVAAVDGAGLTLFSGIRCMPRVEDLPGRALQLVAILRELRGSAHLVAVRASGLDSHVAHFIKRPTDLATFGYAEDAGSVVTDEHRAALVHAEEMTDGIVFPAFDVLDAAGRQALLDGVLAIEAAFA
jgi:hypothetical protein